MDNVLSLEELIDVVKQQVTLNCKLPQTLSDIQIERIVRTDALRYFYDQYKFAVQKTYYYVDIQSFWKNRTTGAAFIQLPDEIRAIRWIYFVGYRDMHNLGFLLPRNSMSLGQTTQPFVASINVGEFAQSVAVMQSLQDSIASFAKNTAKHSFNKNTKRLEIHTSNQYNYILEVYATIPEEYLFGDNYFIKYVTGKAMMEYSIDLSFTTQQLAGNTQISTDRIYDRGEKMVTEVEEYIKSITRTSFFINKTR
jgi:hypothetical protein